MNNHLITSGHVLYWRDLFDQQEVIKELGQPGRLLAVMDSEIAEKQISYCLKK